MQELKAATQKPRFGTMELIRRSEYTQKVTNAGEEVWVVLLLFKDGYESFSCS